MSRPLYDLTPPARSGGLVATDLRDVTSDPAALDATGIWAVVADFEGRLVSARFGDVRRAPVPVVEPGARRGPDPDAGTSSLGRAAYIAAVRARGGAAHRCSREHIAAGEVHQAGLYRVLSAPLPDPERADVDALTALLARGNPAPYAGTVRLPAHDVEIATASPELFPRRDGRTVESDPIKGTGRTAADLLPVTGSSESSALRIIAGLETAPRGPYCGGVGWVDADRGTGRLAVGIRMFWIDRTAPGGPLPCFGTGAGITWGSDPEREWADTRLKARLLTVASGGHRRSSCTPSRAGS